MTNKTEKTINLFRVNEIVELSNELLGRGEVLKSIEYKDDFKFEKGNLLLFGSLSKIKSFEVSITKSDKRIDRTYKAIDESYPLDLSDFKIFFEYTYYED